MGGSRRAQIRLEVLNITNTVKAAATAAGNQQFRLCHVRPRRHTARLHAPDAVDVQDVVLRGLGLAAWGLRLGPESSGLAKCQGRPRWAALVLYAEKIVKRWCSLVCACVALWVAHALAQAPSLHLRQGSGGQAKPQAPSRKPQAALGSVVFPNSGSAAAQADFLRGIAWLHSFMYEDAIDAFRAAQKIDPNFVMAYWGEAMSFSQPLWLFEEVDKGARRWRSWRPRLTRASRRQRRRANRDSCAPSKRCSVPATNPRVRGVRAGNG